jgi:hypothetical protein
MRTLYVDIPDYACIIPISEFIAAVKEFAFVPDDGSAYYATNDKMFAKPLDLFDWHDLKKGLYPVEFNNIAWFNK